MPMDSLLHFFYFQSNEVFNETIDPTDPILDTGFLNVPNAGQVEGLMVCHIMEAKIMKHHVLSCELVSFGGRCLLFSR